MTLDYRQDWPRIENLAAQAEFRNQGMSVKVTSALVGLVKVDSADVRFVDFKTGEMEVHGAAHGDAADALGYLAATPLDALAEKGFSSVEAGCRCAAAWTCSFRSSSSTTRRVLVHVGSADGTVKRRGANLAATDISGRRHRRCPGRARRFARAVFWAALSR